MEQRHAQITIHLKPAVKAALIAFANSQYRDPRIQAGLMLEEMLRGRGLLFEYPDPDSGPDEPPTAPDPITTPPPTPSPRSAGYALPPGDDLPRSWYER